MLDQLDQPLAYADWLTREDLMIYVEAFKTSGFTGPLNRYRAQSLDPQELPQVIGKRLEQATCLIAGSKDPVRHFVQGVDLYEKPADFCDDLEKQQLSKRQVTGYNKKPQKKPIKPYTRSLIAYKDIFLEETNQK